MNEWKAKMGFCGFIFGYGMGMSFRPHRLWHFHAQLAEHILLNFNGFQWVWLDRCEMDSFHFTMRDDRRWGDAAERERGGEGREVGEQRISDENGTGKTATGLSSEAKGQKTVCGEL